jgi:hypothetical protein
MEPIQPPIQWALDLPSLGIYLPNREADRGYECVELYLHSPIRLHGVILKHRDYFTLSNLITGRDVMLRLVFSWPRDLFIRSSLTAVCRFKLSFSVV